MKAIVSREVNGKFSEVGTMNRTIIKARSRVAIRKQAVRYAKGAAVRIEYFFGESIYGTPCRTEVTDAQGRVA